MKTHIIATGFFISLFCAVSFAQQYPPRPDYRQPGPDQPVQPQTPRLERRPTAPPTGKYQPPNQQYPGARQPAPQQPRQPQPQKSYSPFNLTPQEQAQVDRALNQWEQRNEKIKTFDCRFKRWRYDVVFGPPDKARFIEMGVLKYATPDKGLFRVDTMEQDGKEVKADPKQAEHWMCNGESVFRYDPVQQKVIEYKLPPELHGKAIANSPLPFLFGAQAQTLKQRYWVRIVTPPDAKNEVWMEAYPRYQEDAANFHHAQFIVTMPDMKPFALRLVEPNGKNYTVYQFYKIVVNDPLQFFRGDPFRPYVPQGWQLVVENPQPAHAQRPAPSNGRR